MNEIASSLMRKVNNEILNSTSISTSLSVQELSILATNLHLFSENQRKIILQYLGNHLGKLNQTVVSIFMLTCAIKDIRPSVNFLDKFQARYLDNQMMLQNKYAYLCFLKHLKETNSFVGMFPPISVSVNQNLFDHPRTPE